MYNKWWELSLESQEDRRENGAGAIFDIKDQFLKTDEKISAYRLRGLMQIKDVWWTPSRVTIKKTTHTHTYHVKTQQIKQEEKILKAPRRIKYTFKEQLYG